MMITEIMNAWPLILKTPQEVVIDIMTIEEIALLRIKETLLLPALMIHHIVRMMLNMEVVMTYPALISVVAVKVILLPTTVMTESPPATKHK